MTCRPLTQHRCCARGSQPSTRCEIPARVRAMSSRCSDLAGWAIWECNTPRSPVSKPSPSRAARTKSRSHGSSSVLSPGAHLVIYAWLSGVPIHVSQGDLIVKRLNIHGFWMYYEEFLPKMRAALTEATKVVASGKLTLPITTTYKPSQIKEAIEHSQRGGKVLLDFNHSN